jgi:hypothetical protein
MSNILIQGGKLPAVMPALVINLFLSLNVDRRLFLDFRSLDHPFHEYRELANYHHHQNHPRWIMCKSISVYGPIGPGEQ